MTIALLTLGLIVALGLSAFFSGAETGIYCLNHVRLNLRSAQHDRRAARLTRLMKHPRELVITALVGTNIADYIATVCVTVLLLRLAVPEDFAEIVAAIVLTPMILVFGGVLPKDWFQRDADRLMYPLAGALTWCRRVLLWCGLMKILDRFTRFIISKIDPAGVADATDLLPRARIRRLLSEGAVSGGLSEYQRLTLDRVMNLSRVRLANVMIPRKRAAIVSIDIPRPDLLRIARMAHFSRLPVYKDKPENVVGLVNVYDVLMDQSEKPIAEYVQPVTKLHAARTVPQALRALQRSRQVMGVVVDSHGRCLGLFTIKDLVEEIVGDLEAW